MGKPNAQSEPSSTVPVPVRPGFVASLARLNLEEPGGEWPWSTVNIHRGEWPWSIAQSSRHDGTTNALADGGGLASLMAPNQPWAAPRLRVAEPVSQLMQAALEGWGGADAWWVKAEQRHVRRLRPVTVARLGVPLIPRGNLEGIS